MGKWYYIKKKTNYKNDETYVAKFVAICCVL